MKGRTARTAATVSCATLLAALLPACEAVIGPHDLTLAAADASADGIAADGADAPFDGAHVVGQLIGNDKIPASVVELTKQGTSDWAHWGLTTADSFSDKATGGGKIPKGMVIGSSPATQYNNDPIGYSWTDGAPEGTVTNSTTGIEVAGLGDGFTLAVPAGQTTQTLKVFVGGFKSAATFVAHLSDSSAPDYTNAAYSGGRQGYDAVFTLTFNAATPGQSLVVTWTMTQDTGMGSVTLQSAVLQ